MKIFNVLLRCTHSVLTVMYTWLYKSTQCSHNVVHSKVLTTPFTIVLWNNSVEHSHSPIHSRVWNYSVYSPCRTLWSMKLPGTHRTTSVQIAHSFYWLQETLLFTLRLQWERKRQTFLANTWENNDNHCIVRFIFYFFQNFHFGVNNCAHFA